MLLDFLKKNFGPGKPIFTSDAEGLGLSPTNLRQQFKKLCDSHQLLRFEAGVFFLPDPDGEYYPKPSANMEAEYKYISNEREVKVAKTPFFIRCSRIPINSENCHILQLLDLLKDVEEYTDYKCEEEAPERIKGFIQRAKITRADIDKYIGEFPLKTYKSIYDLRLESVLA